MAQRTIGRAAQLNSPALQLREVLTRTRRPLLIAALLIAAGLAPIIALVSLFDITTAELTRDIFVVPGIKPYTGLLSNIGLVVWVVAAAVWLLSAGLMRRFAPAHDLLPLALIGGLYTIWLFLDDALMLHEEYLPRFAGIPEDFLMALYAGSALALLALGARRILRTNYLLCLAAGGLFAASMLSDSVLPMSGAQLLLEDGMKFAGIVLWAGYAVDTAFQLVGELRLRRA